MIGIGVRQNMYRALEWTNVKKQNGSAAHLRTRRVEISNQARIPSSVLDAYMVVSVLESDEYSPRSQASLTAFKNNDELVVIHGYRMLGMLPMGIAIC
jgi:hypothetical protein